MPSYLVTGASRGLGLGFVAELVSSLTAENLLPADNRKTAQEQRQRRNRYCQEHSCFKRPTRIEGRQQRLPAHSDRPRCLQAGEYPCCCRENGKLAAEWSRLLDQ